MESPKSLTAPVTIRGCTITANNEERLNLRNWTITLLDEVIILSLKVQILLKIKLDIIAASVAKSVAKYVERPTFC